MYEITLMDPSKVTEKKLRWIADINGAPFELYIPKRRVPEPWPVQIIVTVTDDFRRPHVNFHSNQDRSKPIQAIITKVVKHTRTVRYRPHGDNNEWEIGEPYIPKEILEAISPSSIPERLQIEVRWDYSAGTWSDE